MTNAAEQTCPDQKTLEKFLLGLLPAEQQNVYEQHVLKCPECVQNAETMQIEDDITRISLGVSDEFKDRSPDLLELISRIKEARQSMETMGVGETLVTGHPSLQSGKLSGEAQSGLQFLSPPETDDELGRLGGYRILKILGSGGMGMVLLGEDLKLRRRAAIKVMKRSVAESETAKARFLREAQATAALEHDHIVAIYQVGEDRGVPFIAMQYLKGESLAARLGRDKIISPLEVIRIGKETAMGLAVAHREGMIHRDIKPDNLWLEGDAARIKILDFGLVSATSSEQDLTMSGMVLGTPRYMSPEQALAQPVDERCDLFSLGSVLYQAAAGDSPFLGNNFTSTLIAVAHKPPLPLQNAAPEFPAAAATLIMQLLEKDPANRPQSAMDVATQFAKLEQEMRQPVRSSATEELLSDKAAFLPHSDPITPPRKPPKSKKLFLAGAGGLAALVLGIFVFTIRDQDGNESVIKLPSGTKTQIDAQPGSTVVISEEADTQDAILIDSMNTVPARTKLASPGTDSTINDDSDRVLAEWVLSMPEPRNIRLSGMNKVIERKEDLPPGKFRITELFCGNAGEFTDEDLERIATARLNRIELSSKDMRYRNVTDRGLMSLASSRSSETCQTLDILGDVLNATDESFLAFNKWRKLSRLVLYSPNFTDKAIGELKLPLLEYVEIKYQSVDPKGVQFTSASLEDLDARLPKLSTLSLANADLLNADFSKLQLRKLNSLFLHLCKINDTQLQAISEISTIEEIGATLSGEDVTDVGFEHFSKLSNLRILHLHCPTFEDRAMRGLSLLSKLSLLNLTHCSVTDAGLSKLESMFGLENLCMHSTEISDAGLPAIARLPKLMVLNLNNCHNITRWVGDISWDEAVGGPGYWSESEFYRSCHSQTGGRVTKLQNNK